MLLDRPNEERDELLADHIMMMHACDAEMPAQKTQNATLPNSQGTKIFFQEAY